MALHRLIAVTLLLGALLIAPLEQAFAQDEFVATLRSAWALEKEKNYQQALDETARAEKMLEEFQITGGPEIEAVKITEARILLALNRPGEALQALQSIFFSQYRPASLELEAYVYDRLGLFFEARVKMNAAIELMETLPDFYKPDDIARRKIEEAYLGARSDVWGGAYEKWTEQAAGAAAYLRENDEDGPFWLIPRLLRIYDRPLQALDGFLDLAPEAESKTKLSLLSWAAEIQLDYDMIEAARLTAQEALDLAEDGTYRKDHLTILRARADLKNGDMNQEQFIELVEQTLQIRETNEAFHNSMIFMMSAFHYALQSQREAAPDVELLKEVHALMKSWPEDMFISDRVGQDSLRALQLELAEQFEQVGEVETSAALFDKARLSWAVPNAQYARAAAGLARVADWSVDSRLIMAEDAVDLARTEIELMPARLPSTEKTRLVAFERIFETHLHLAWLDMYERASSGTALAFWELTGQVEEPPENLLIFEWQKILPDVQGEVFFSFSADVLEKVIASAQLARLTEAGRAAAATTGKLADGTGELGRLIRDRDALIAQRELLARQGSDLRLKVRELDKQIDAIDEQLERVSPGYTAFSRPPPMTLEELQAVLAKDETLLLMFEGAEGIHLWFATKDHFVWYRPNVSPEQLAVAVDTLRQQLDPTSASRSAEALTDLPDSSAGFDFETAHSLYTDLLSPIDLIAPHTGHILVVPDGALHSLPLSLLLTGPGSEDGQTLRDAPWAIKRFAFTTLPIAASLRKSTDSENTTNKGSAKFVGIGDPILGGDLTPLQLAQADIRRSVNSDDVRSLTPLPETAVELAAINDIVAGGTGDLLLRERAIEPIVRDGRLSDANVISFATHGLMAGDLPGQTEPALVLTPPVEPDLANDGLLSASEIAKMTLSADWVILSACNTAAGAGTGDSEGLSGLSRAFFYAGARSLAVSHWSVQSEPTVDLISGMFKAANAAPRFGKAGALQASMIEMITYPRRAGFDHPSAWAPFVVVGR